jgi:AcrR family transcriptional regulator
MARAVARKKGVELDDRPVRQRILASASRAFAENGYARTGTREIAARARVSKRELYALFGDKRALLTACVMTRLERIRPPTELPPARTRAELVEQLTGVGSAILRAIGAPEAVAMIRLAVVEAEQSPDVASAIDGVRASNLLLLTRIFETAQAARLVGPGAPASMASQFLGLLWGNLLLELLLGLAELPGASALEDRAREAAWAILTLHDAGGGP